jgi:hypothetical protein
VIFNNAPIIGKGPNSKGLILTAAPLKEYSRITAEYAQQVLRNWWSKRWNLSEFCYLTEGSIFEFYVQGVECWLNMAITAYIAYSSVKIV